ncbi:MAG: biotin synthase [Burkholderiaceae bacterium]
MATERPPSIDPTAARRYAELPAAGSAWLHEEVGRRMAERLQWIKLQPARWADWGPVRGGLVAHAAVTQRYPKAECFVVESIGEHIRLARRALRKPWWDRSPWATPAPRFEAPTDVSLQMVWANMALHMAADPQSLVTQWHRALAPDGFLMFSCFGPDTLLELRALYQAQGWPPPSHEFTDMHDWGDMLVNAGFAEPVMDMERITLSFATPQRLLEELRGLGRNLHAARFPALRGRHWHADLLRALATLQPSQEPPGGLTVTFEIIYGHAFRPAPRVSIQSETVLSLDEMRRELRRGKAASGSRT